MPSLASSLTERVSNALTESQQPLRIGGDEVISDISWRANIRAWWLVGAAALLPLLATAASLATAQPGATWSLLPAALLLAATFGLWAWWNTLANTANRSWQEHPNIPEDLDPSRTIARYKSPVIAVALTLFTSGSLGYLYLGQRSKAMRSALFGLGMFALMVAATLLTGPTIVWALGVAASVASVLMLVDTWLLARRLSAGVPIGSKETAVQLLDPVLGNGPQVP